MALGIDTQSRREWAAGHFGGINFSTGRSAGSKITDHRSHVATGNAKGKRIGWQHAPRAAIRRDLAPIFACAATKHDGEATGLCAPLHIGADAAGVVYIGHAHRRHAMDAGVFNQVIGGQAKGWHAQVVAAVDQRAAAFGLAQYRLGLRVKFALGKSLGIPVQPEDAMRIHATQICIDQVVGNFSGHRRITTNGLHGGSAKALQGIGGYARVAIQHGGPLCLAPKPG